MGIITKIAFRNMKRRKTRYIMTTITLVIGVALFGGILINRDSFKVMFMNDIDKRMGSADVLIRNTETDDGWFDPDELKDEDIDKIAHVEEITYRISGFEVYVSSTSDGNQAKNSTKTSVYGMDPKDDAEIDIGGKPDILESENDGKTIEDLLEDAKDDEVIITEALKIKLGKDFEAGDHIWVLPKDWYLIIGKDQDDVSSDTGLWKKYTVLAIVRDLGEARDFDPETPSDFEIPSQGPCLFVTIETAHDLVDGTEDHDGQFTLAAVGVDDINNVEIAVDDIEDDLDEDKWVVADLKSDTVEEINQSVEMMMTMFQMFAIIGLILSVILILNIFNIIKEEQEYETGMLQAIGASKQETFRMFLTQGVIMGIIGALIGTICSYFMSYLIFYITVESLKNMPGFIGEIFAESEVNIKLIPQTLAVTFGIGVVSCILASIYPSWKASRKPIIECLNPLAQKAEREKKRIKRTILYVIMGSALVLYGIYLLFFETTYGPGQEGQEGTFSEASTAFLAPTLVVLGIIWLMALIVGPLTSVFIKIFGRYLKQTKLLTKKNVLRHRKRTVLTFSMIALTVSYLIGLSIFMSSMRAGVAVTVNDVMGCDIRIFVANSPRDFRDDLLDEEGVEEAMGISHQNCLIKDGNDWVGHSLLEKEYDESISVHILDTDIVAKRMTETTILEPADMTLEQMMDKLDHEDKVIITENEAEDFDLEVGDEVLVRFSLGISYPSLSDMFEGNTDNAIEVFTERELEVVAIVEKFQGFATGEIVGQDEDFYNIFISWETYENIARENLPLGNTDIIFRNKTNSGISKIDNAFTNWFNFSDVSNSLDNIDGIDYYTTRMEYFSPTYDNDTVFNPSNPQINFDSFVVGIRTNTSGSFVSDSYFGQNQLINKSNAYDGLTIEELLNNTTGVCVVDETYVKNMQKYDPLFGINSTIAIFPQKLQNIIYNLPLPPQFFPYSFYINSTAVNGTQTGSIDSLMFPNEFNTITIDSNKTSLEWIIDFNMTSLMSYYINPFNITIKSFVNTTMEQLDLQVLNHYTKNYDKLGALNSTNDLPREFFFNGNTPPFTYINQSNFILRLNITGQNTTYNSDYRLTLDYLRIGFVNSTYPLIPIKWPTFKVIGIIEDPLLYQTERINWLAGYEIGYDILEAENSVYINYEDARNLVYLDYNGSETNGSNDKITHVLIHCKSIDDIPTTKSALQNDLGSTFTIVDTKSYTLEIRTYAFDWYIWIEEGYDDEEVLEQLIEMIEDEGYIVLFGFTGSFITAIFQSMIDLITLIMNGILIFAIIIAMIGLALHCLLSTMARRREIGMLRSIGLNKKGVVRTISGETLVVSLLGSLIGIFAGILTGVLMVISVPQTSFLSVSLTIETFPWLTIGILFGVTILTAILSSRYPSKWAANIVIIDAVRTR